MFTGLIETTGTIVEMIPPRTAVNKSQPGPTRLTVSSESIAPRLRLGDSVAVNGVCLTALDVTATTFSADLAEETLARTTLSGLRRGTVVNLELPTPSGSPLGGHVVQGHVDGVGTLLEVEPVDAEALESTDWRMRFCVPSHLAGYIAPQGSITVDGISLTVAQIKGDVIQIAVIPHTYRSTTVHTYSPGSAINIEVDILAKYAERQARLAPPAQWKLTEEYLLENGY